MSPMSPMSPLWLNSTLRKPYNAATIDEHQPMGGLAVKFTDLRRGDLMFYEYHPLMEAPHPVGHVAIVQSYKTPTPRVIHLDKSGILSNTVSEDKLVDTAFLVFRHSDQAIAEKAATTAFNWLIHSGSESYPSRSGRQTVLLTKGVFNNLALKQSGFRSSSYGRGARSFVHRLCSECGDYPPKEFTQLSSLFDRGAICSGFVIAAYQTALGESLCPTHLALDARNTTPLRLKKHLDNHPFWHSAGTIPHIALESFLS